MLSGGAAEREDSSEREKGQSPLDQPSGTELSLNTLEITELPLNQPSGTELSRNLSSGAELSPIQPSGIEPLIVKETATVLTWEKNPRRRQLST